MKSTILAIGTTNNGKRHPTLKDRVFVGSGAKILGPITVGSDARIGAQSVVLTDIPDSCTAVGIPARILRRKQTCASPSPQTVMGAPQDISAYSIPVTCTADRPLPVVFHPVSTPSLPQAFPAAPAFPPTTLTAPSPSYQTLSPPPSRCLPKSPLLLSSYDTNSKLKLSSYTFSNPLVTSLKHPFPSTSP